MFTDLPPFRLTYGAERQMTNSFITFDVFFSHLNFFYFYHLSSFRLFSTFLGDAAMSDDVFLLSTDKCDTLLSMGSPILQQKRAKREDKTQEIEKEREKSSKKTNRRKRNATAFCQSLHSTDDSTARMPKQK